MLNKICEINCKYDACVATFDEYVRKCASYVVNNGEYDIEIIIIFTAQEKIKHVIQKMKIGCRKLFRLRTGHFVWPVEMRVLL